MREWWRDAVIYQIYPRSFQDTTGDGIGDLNGITQRLDHVARLGVDCIWLSPIFTSPQADMGYDVSDYTDIDPIFGTLDDFDRMLAKAHDLGLKVITDQVLSHTSDKHPWFIESRKDRTNPKADWYVWADPKPDGSPPTNWHSHFGGPAWEFDATRGQYYLHNFLSQQPDLNFHNPEVRRGDPRDGEVLAGPRPRRLPARHRELLLSRQEAAVQPGSQGHPSGHGDRPLRDAGQHPQQEPEGKPRLPRAVARALRPVRRHHDGRARSATWANGPSTSWPQYTKGKQPPAHGLQLCHAGSGFQCRAFPGLHRRASRKAPPTASRSGLSRTTT